MFKKIAILITIIVLVFGSASQAARNPGAWDTFKRIMLAVPSNMIPSADDTYDLGSATYNWQDLFLSGNITLTDGTDTSIIKHIQEPGLGGRLTIGLDETARTMVIIDAGDVDTDLGLSAVGNPSLFIFNAAATMHLQINSSSFTTADVFTYRAARLTFQIGSDQSFGDMNTFNSDSNIELIDTDGEQAWLYIEPKINQSGTAAYNGLHVNVLETTPGSSFGDGSTGQGNNLLLLEIESVPKFRVDRTGSTHMTSEGTHGGDVIKIYSASTGTLPAAATDTIQLNIPTGWVIQGCQLHVKTALAGGDTWDAELNDGATEEAIASNQAVTQNTNVNHHASADAGYGGTLTDAETDILITKNGGGSFTAQGEIEATCIAKGFDAWDAE